LRLASRLHEESNDVPVWTLCARHALIFKSLKQAAQKLKEIKAHAKSWPNGDFFSFAIIEDRRERPCYFASKLAAPITGA
jgi:hypothetical protein